METFYLLCAVVGGTVLVCQFLITLLGLGADADSADDISVDADHADGPHDHGHGSNWIFNVITFRTVIAAITFFGTSGMACLAAGLTLPQTLAISIVTGVAAMFAVFWLMQSMHRFNYDGTMRIDNAIGRHGTVYLSIPARQQGSGKVQINLQDQLVELTAVTFAGEALKPGMQVVVVSIIGSNTVEVAPLVESAEVAEV
ncbi:MAG: hypothetical protein WDZ59_01550 [Pirellulales bacterium]